MNDKKNVVRKTKRSIYGSSTCRGIMTLLSFFALIVVVKTVFALFCAFIACAFIGMIICGIVWFVARFHEEIFALIAGLVTIAWNIVKYSCIGIIWCCKKIFSISRAYLKENNPAAYRKCADFFGRIRNAFSRFWAWLY